MNKKLFSLLLTAAVMASAVLTGCGQSSSTGASTQGQPVAKAGVVTLTTTFPGTTGATKSLIPTGTQSIAVYASSSPIPEYYSPGMPDSERGTLIATLTPAAPTATVNMLPGNYYIGAFAFDSTDPTTRRLLSVAMSGGTIVAGANSIELTFVNGIWTITDATGGALTLTDGTVLNDIVIGGGEGYSQPMYKSAIDYTKPVGTSGGMVRYRFNNNTSAITYGGIESQFNGTTKSNRIHSDMYNVTRKCSSFSNYTSCNDRLGDHLIMVSSSTTSGESYYSSKSGIKQGNASELLPNKDQTVFNKDMTSMLTDTTLTSGKTISGSLLEVVLTAAPTSTIVTTAAVAAKRVALAVKSASSNTSLSGVTATDQQYIIYNLSGGTNKGGWQFYSAKQTSDGKTCYTGGYLQPTYTQDPVTFQYTMSYNAGDYSYGLVPTTTDLGEYCHIFNGTTCTQQKPTTGDIYYPNFFYDLNGDGIINYGSFSFQFYLEEAMTFDVFKYLFTATGK